MTTEKSIVAAAAAWEILTNSLGFQFTARDSKSKAKEMMSLLDRLLETAAELSDKAPAGLQGLIDFATDWVTAYESRHEHIQASNPVELLTHLMNSNGLVQTDLTQELGGQSVVSSILRGVRKINGRQAVELGNRFGISAAAFLEGANTESPTTTMPIVDTQARVRNVSQSNAVFWNARQSSTPHSSATEYQTRNWVIAVLEGSDKRMIRNYDVMTNLEANITVELQDSPKKHHALPTNEHAWSRRKPVHA